MPTPEKRGDEHRGSILQTCGRGNLHAIGTTALGVSVRRSDVVHGRFGMPCWVWWRRFYEPAAPPPSKQSNSVTCTGLAEPHFGGWGAGSAPAGAERPPCCVQP